MRSFLDQHQLLRPDGDGLVRLPMLMRGELVAPEEISCADAEAALGAHGYVDTGIVQLVRRPLIDPGAGPPGAGGLVFVLPTIHDPAKLSVEPADAYVTVLGALRAADIAEHLRLVGELLNAGTVLFERLREITRLVDDTPIAYLDAAFDDIHRAFAPEQTLAAIDRELTFGSRPGRAFLDDWVALDTTPPGLTARLSGLVHYGAPLPVHGRVRVHAARTRQLHITAGNSPIIPLISALRGLSVRGAVTLKAPAGALAAGAGLALALHAAGPQHPLTRFCSVVYWRGGDERIEDRLFAPGAFDRIVVWGAPEAVDSVLARAGRTKSLVFNPRYGVSLIGADALTDDQFSETVRRAVTDAQIWNQKACIASLVCYLEGDAATAYRFATAVATELAEWDGRFPSYPGPDTTAALRQARRGGMRHGTWHPNGNPRSPSSAAVVFEDSFDLSTHPASRVIAIRPVPRMEDVIPSLHHGISQVGVRPENRRLELRDQICATGVTGVLPLGEADTADFTGLPQDGMRSLSELVSWVTG